MDSFPVSKVVPFPVRDTALSLCSMSGSSLSERLWKPDNPLMESNSGYCCLYPPQTHMKIYGRGGLSTYTAGLSGSRTGGGKGRRTRGWWELLWPGARDTMLRAGATWGGQITKSACKSVPKGDDFVPFKRKVLDIVLKLRTESHRHVVSFAVSGRMCMTLTWCLSVGGGLSQESKPKNQSQRISQDL